MYQYFIGSNNSTGLVELDKIREVLADYEIAGYTIINSTGFWEATTEPSVIVQIEGITKSRARDLVNVFKVRLEQFSVGFQSLPEVQFI